jgi:hypothetical protein
VRHIKSTLSVQYSTSRKLIKHFLVTTVIGSGTAAKKKNVPQVVVGEKKEEGEKKFHATSISYPCSSGSSKSLQLNSSSSGISSKSAKAAHSSA